MVAQFMRTVAATTFPLGMLILVHRSLTVIVNNTLHMRIMPVLTFCERLDEILSSDSCCCSLEEGNSQLWREVFAVMHSSVGG